MKEIENAFTEAGQAARQYGLKTMEGLTFAAEDEVGRWRGILEGELQDLAGTLSAATAGLTGELADKAIETDFGPFADLVRQFIADARGGQADVPAFKKAVEQLALTKAAGDVVRDIAKTPLDTLEAGTKAAEGYLKAEAMLAVLDGTATSAQRALLGVKDALDEVSAHPGPLTNSARQAEDESMQKYWEELGLKGPPGWVPPGTGDNKPGTPPRARGGGIGIGPPIDLTRDQTVAVGALSDKMSEFKDATRDALGTLVDGLREGKSLSEAFGDVLDGLADKLTNKVLDMAVDQLFAGLGGGLGIPGADPSGARFGPVAPFGTSMPRAAISRRASGALPARRGPSRSSAAAPA